MQNLNSISRRRPSVTTPQINSKKQRIVHQLDNAASAIEQFHMEHLTDAPQWASAMLGLVNQMVGMCRELVTMVREQDGERNPNMVFDEERRQHSVVIAQLPESNSPTPTQRATEDLANVKELMDHCEVECLPTQVYRMGKKQADGRPRLLKVELPTKFHTNLFLRNKNKIKNFNKFSKVLLRPSLSKSDLIDRARLISLCKSQRENDPSCDYIVYAGHVLARNDIPSFKSDPNFKCICHNKSF
ncbi:hypothetical protein niasHS_004273 [Heterodera schachtii]|uniref:Uncharacterized protein n=1 Tax=Heterodera schachtii TaxID=97005 RepID=A0ABD2JKJ1_HETSC